MTGMDALLCHTLPLGFANDLGRLRKFCSLITLIVNRKTRKGNPEVYSVPLQV